MLTENETRSLIEFINKFFGLDLSENLKPIALSELTKFKKIKCNTKKVNKLKHAWSNTKRANRERLNVLKKSKAF